MLDLIRNILELVLFPTGELEGLVVVSQLDSTSQDSKLPDEYIVSPALFPESCQVLRLPGDEGFVELLPVLLREHKPSRLLIFPPMMSYRDLSPTLHATFPRINLEEIALRIAVSTLSPGSLVAVVLPAGFFSSESSRHFREQITQDAIPRFVITHDHSWHGLGFQHIHPAFRINTLVVEVGKPEIPTLRFFKCPIASGTKQKEVISDLRRLIRQGGGSTKYGYVLRDGLPPGSPLLHDMYRPDLLDRQEELAHVGAVRPLSELVEVHRGLHTILQSDMLLDGDSSQGIPFIEGSDIRADGSIAYKETRYKVQATSKIQLQVGDLCLRAIMGTTRRLYVGLIEEHLLPCASSQSVLVLRPKVSTTTEDMELVLAYLRSGMAAEIIRARGTNIQLNAKAILELPVPVPDKGLRLALSSLNKAERQFEVWKDEIERTRSSLFDFSSPKDARLQMLAVGRLVRRRQEAAALIDDFRYRVRTQFPHPIAYRWRTAETSHPDLEGYVHVLECAEITVSYIACMAIVMASVIEDAEIKRVHEMAKKLSSSNPQGTTMGDWLAILREVRDSKQFRNIPELVPFYEVLHFLRDNEVDGALQRLATERNKQAHLKGPKTFQVKPAFDSCLPDLEVLLQATEFLAEYPLRYIERTQRDSLQEVTFYDYRDLMGDHPLVPLAHTRTDTPELEAGSLYLVDREENLHLFRPLLNRRECPECGRWAMFYLDTYERDGDCSVLKSMEHGHVIKDSELSRAFRQIGLLLNTQI